MADRGPSAQEFQVLAALVNLNGRQDWAGGLSYSSLARLTGISQNNLDKPLRRLAGRGWIKRVQEGGWAVRESAADPVAQAMVKNQRWRTAFVCSEFNEHLCRARGHDGVLLARLVSRILCGLPWSGNLADDLLALQRLSVPTDVAAKLISSLTQRNVEGTSRRLYEGSPPLILAVLPRTKARGAGNALATSPSFFVECVRKAPLQSEFVNGKVRVNLPAETGAKRELEGELWLVVERLALICQMGDEATGATIKSRVLRFEGGDNRPGQVVRVADEMRSIMEEGTRLFGGARSSMTVCDLHLEGAREFFQKFKGVVEPATEGVCAVTINYPDGQRTCARPVAWKIVGAAGAFDVRGTP